MYLQRVKTRIGRRIPSPLFSRFTPDRAALQVSAVFEQQALLLARKGLDPKTGLRAGQPYEADPVGVVKYLA